MNERSLARGLGALSLLLGAIYLPFPRRFTEWLGARPVIGAYGGFVDKFPIGAVMNRSLTIRSGQAHAQRYLRPLLARMQAGEVDPSFIATHRLPLDEAPRGYETFKNKQDECIKVVLMP